MEMCRLYTARLMRKSEIGWAGEWESGWDWDRWERLRTSVGLMENGNDKSWGSENVAEGRKRQDWDTLCDSMFYMFYNSINVTHSNSHRWRGWKIKWLSASQKSGTIVVCVCSSSICMYHSFVFCISSHLFLFMIVECPQKDISTLSVCLFAT